MSSAVAQLSPNGLWANFNNLNAVPRGSKKEDRVIQFMKDFGNRLGLETFEDEIRNVIIRKPATPGMENKQPIILQSHLDMVHQKNNDVAFDFDSQGIQMMIDGDWVRANGTTLGADNGIGVATIMAILESKSIAHPAIEALFTIDEETGMTGALGLKGGVLNGRILLNLDTENDSEIDIGCAGGIDVTANGTYTEENVAAGSIGLTITVKGLNGGHSGMDIHKGLGNANKIMNRILYSLVSNYNVNIASVNGGSLRNAIPRESVAVLAVAKTSLDEVKTMISALTKEIAFEFKTTEPSLKIEVADSAVPAVVMNSKRAQQIVQCIYAAHNGVYRMSADMHDLVETSNNVAKVTIEGGKITIACLTRSSVESSKMDLANQLKCTFELGGCDVSFAGSYPGWTPNVSSPILKVLVDVYEKLHGDKPEVVACHAGLECGILGSNYPGMDMISFGPTILGAHSPDERVSIPSVQKFWDYLMEILKNIPEKK
ncbi:MAG TPA: aminoacyl-histidine dipeptidase [Bacteroidia bacterium]|nr:aminoacyl-histidine dipeptidase [Bacteroidia bacterium]